MEKIEKAWVVATRKESVKSLASFASELAEFVVVFSIGDILGDIAADEVYALDLPQGALPSVANDTLCEKLVVDKPGMVFVEATKDGQLIAAALSVHAQTSTLSDVSEISVQGGRILTKRMVYGGSAFKTEAAMAPAIVTLNPACIQGKEFAPREHGVTGLPCASDENIVVLSNESKPTSKIDLSSERIVVGIGRGMGSGDNAPAVCKFAETIGAGIGCTRPVGEEEHWFGDTGYLGISGDCISPEIYIAAGVSGQVQHMVGITGAKMIFAINKDPKATIFDDCDYGIVGDMNVVIPALTEMFAAS